MKIDSLEYYRAQLPEGEFDLYWRYPNVFELLEESTKKYGAYPFVQWNKGVKTLSEARLDASKIRGLLKAKGIKKSTNIGVMFKNEYNFVRCFLGVSTYGAVSVNLPSNLTPELLSGLIKKFDIEMIMYCEECEGLITATHSLGVDFISVSPSELEQYDPADGFDIDDDDVAAIIFTGGTTGNPKGAMLTHRNLTRGCVNGCYGVGTQLHLKYLSLIPFTHVFGLIKNMLSMIQTGSCLYVVKEPSLFIKEMAYAQPDAVIMVPALVNLLYSLIKAYGLKICGPNLKCIQVGGAAVPASLVSGLHDMGFVVNVGYGSTETSNLIAGSANDFNHPSSVGIAYPYQKFRVENGELWVKGENVFKGYYNDKENTEAAFEDGWFKTGDLVNIDDEGFFYIVGRIKNVIVFESGQKVSPEVIEEMINVHPLVNSSLVYIDKNDQGKEILTVQVYPDYPVCQKTGVENIEETIKGIVDSVNSKNVEFERIRKVIVRKEDFIRSNTTKILREKNICLKD